MRTTWALLLFISCVCIAQQRVTPATGHDGWPQYGGSDGLTHYLRFDQINTTNAHKLQVAWRYDSGDEFRNSEMQCNPIMVDGLLYVTTPKLRVVALDAATGKEVWSFDPFEGAPVRNKMRNRGVNYANGRIYVAARQWLWSIDAKTGKPDTAFGTGGKIDLREGLGRPVEGLSIGLSTPGVVYKDMLIVGSNVSEGLPSAPGHIRAYDLATGKQRWIFHTIPQPGEFGYNTWPKETYKHTGGVNNWSGMTLDAQRGLVFAPTGSAAFDFYGADRHGDNLFANCLLALDANTGKRVWHFQFVRHDVWDRDLPTPPVLVTIKRNGKMVDAVAQITKSGHVWVFDRETGKSLFPYKERTVPQSKVPGEKLASKQPLPLKPESFSRQIVTEEILTQRTPEAHEAALKQFKTVLTGDQFTPPSAEGTFVFPGFDGGGEWGGPAYDPESGLLYVNANEMAWVLRIKERPRPTRDTTASALYKRDCASCHRADYKGTPPEFPALDNLAGRSSEADIVRVIRKGSGRMPAFAQMSEAEASAIANLLLKGEDAKLKVEQKNLPQPWLPYTFDGYNKFLDPDGYPAIAPPWGTFSAINLDTGEYAWKIPFGEYPELAAKGMTDTGSENYGGPIVTSGGLLFIGATNYDKKFRVMDKKTGKVLWETTLPAAGNATPASYMLNGKQYVVIGAGGGKSKDPTGGSYIAFALPD